MSGFDPKVTTCGGKISLVLRHKTALNRNRLSQPMALLTSYGVIRSGRTVLDYGCGRGDDVSALDAAGYDISGWDPHFEPKEYLEPADVVNLGFVLNVIENQAERSLALRRAWELTKSVLSVAVMIGAGQQTPGQRCYRDGLLTSRGTFQKYFSHAELQAYIADITEKSAVSVAPGIVFLFRDRVDEEEFLFERYASRNRDVSGIISRRVRSLAVSKPPVEDRIASVLEEIAEFVVTRARLPYPDELSPASDDLLRSERVSLQRASDLAIQTLEPEQVESAGRTRHEDLLVFGASTMLRARKLEAPSGSAIGRDIRSHFGSRSVFEEQIRTFLFGLADTMVMTERMATAGRQGIGILETEDRLLVASRRIDELPASLRCYVACASILADPPGEYLVRIEPQRKRVKFFTIDKASDFFPMTRQQIVVDLRNQRVFEQSRPRSIVRKSDLFGMHPRSKQRSRETAVRDALGLPLMSAFTDGPIGTSETR